MIVFLIIVAYLACCLPLLLGLKNKWKLGIWLTGLALFLLSMLLYWSGVYTDSLWFNNLGYDSIFWKILSLKWVAFLITVAAVFAFIKFNAWIAMRAFPGFPKPAKPDSDRDSYHYRRSRSYSTETAETDKWLVEKVGVNIFAGLMALITGLITAGQWQKILLYQNGGQFNVADPIFGKDVGFYVFQLPFYGYIAGLVFWVVLLTLVGLFLMYLFYHMKAESFDIENIKIRSWAAIHLVLVGVSAIGILIWQRILGFYWYLSQDGGVVFGAGYADVFRMGMNKVFIAALVILALILLVRIFWKGIFASPKRWIPVVALVPAVWLIFMGIVPGIVQKFAVQPNEIHKESQYISYNIEFTQRAFGLNDIETREMSSEALTPAVLQQNQTTLDNIRLWDWRALQDTYKQIQAIRLYYDFPDVDIDRYMIDGKYRQVMLAARELDQSRLPEQTWVNKHLTFTHGYGVVLNAVNEFAANGEPKLLVKDIPPVSTVAGIKITKPQIYHGDLTRNYILVKTTEKEFDYPQGDDNIFTEYEGNGGVELNSFIKKLAFALKFNDQNILFSQHLTTESRLMWHREIKERVKTILPFLFYDRDDYLVIDEAGNLVTIQDAYTATNDYPYSEPQKIMPDNNNIAHEVNYIRNAVKATINSYTGQTNFYVFDDQDPIVQAYQKAFPGLLKPKTEMPADLLSHVRYPEDLLDVQANVYRAYHMADVRVFYNKEDVWQFAKEKYEAGEQPVIPYYVVVGLPGQAQAEFLQMIPFTPQNRNNMIAWMAGRSDRENYGKLLLYKFSKQQLIYGPLQIEAKIDQNEEMREKLTLWSKDTTVIRGNTLVIPLGNSVLYVEPVYLKAPEAKMPQLTRVIVAASTKWSTAGAEEDLKLAWDTTFEGALKKVISGSGVVVPTKPTEPQITLPAGTSAEILQQLEQIKKLWQEYQERLETEMNELEGMLK